MGAWYGDDGGESNDWNAARASQRRGRVRMSALRSTATTEPTSASAGDRYDSTSIWMHWVTAATVLLLWILGQTIDWFPRGTPRTGARTAHILLGATLAVLLIARIAWRARRGHRIVPSVPERFRSTARVMHWLLYVVLGAAIVLGISNAWIRGRHAARALQDPVGCARQQSPPAAGGGLARGRREYPIDRRGPARPRRAGAPFLLERRGIAADAAALASSGARQTQARNRRGRAIRISIG